MKCTVHKAFKKDQHTEQDQEASLGILLMSTMLCEYICYRPFLQISVLQQWVNIIASSKNIKLFKMNLKTFEYIVGAKLVHKHV